MDCDGRQRLCGHLRPANFFSRGNNNAYHRCDNQTGHTLGELDEYFILSITRLTAGASFTYHDDIPNRDGIGPIINDDPVNVLVVDDSTVMEGDLEHTITATVRSASTSNEIATVNFSTSNGSATAGRDYQETSGTLVFLPGTLTQTVSVLIYGNTLIGDDKDFYINIDSPDNALILDSQCVITLINDEFSMPSLSINDIVVTVEDENASEASFNVNLSSPSEQEVFVDFETVDGTAKQGEDYEYNFDTLDFYPWETSRHINIQINGNLFTEAKPDLLCQPDQPSECNHRHRSWPGYTSHGA